MFGGDPFPYGIEENRATWEQMRSTPTSRASRTGTLKPEEIFPKGIMTKVVV